MASRDSALVARHGLLTSVASVVVKHKRSAHRLQQLWPRALEHRLIGSAHGLQQLWPWALEHRLIDLAHGLCCPAAGGVSPDQE